MQVRKYEPLCWLENRVKILKAIIHTAYFVAAMVSTGCLIYVVIWLNALRKGWLI